MKNTLQPNNPTTQSLGSINIVTPNNVAGGGVERVDFSKIDPKQKEINVTNLKVDFPANIDRKKNKNDFYRFLLQQNFGSTISDGSTEAGSSLMHNAKIYNDILIPRSILKKNEGEPRRKGRDGDTFDDLLSGADQLIDPSEAVIGRGLEIDGPILSPRAHHQNYLQNQYRMMDLHE